jgi:hypothetical protein
MALSVTALVQELTNPKYAELIDAGSDQGIADMLNAVDPTIIVPRGRVETWEILAATVRTEWEALTADAKQLYLTIISAGVVDTTDPQIRAMLGSLFPAGTATRANLLARLTRPGSRAEQLFGTGTVISAVDVAKALGRS